jgi:hypothetical protein
VDAAGEDLLQLLARAMQQFHTYPPASPLCQNAVEACQRSLALSADREHVAFRVNPHELIVDGNPRGRGTIIEMELARRLHAASIAEVTIQRAATGRELSHFCLDLLRCGERGQRRLDLIGLLAEHGVDRIALRAAYRPEVLEVGAPTSVAGLLEQERARREQLFASGGVVTHLYPPDKGWVRVDPAAGLDNVSLIDLALLAEDPATLATMLLRLTDDRDAERVNGADALTQKFSDVATLFAALDPRLARVMFSRLAQAVLGLDSEHRQALLRRTILPGLLDGRMEGSVLRDFPDVDLADSLSLLLDLETAAPEVVTSALARLDLPADRQASVTPLLERRLHERDGGSPETGVDAHARRLIKIERGRAAGFAEFSAFDLALDQEARDTLVRIRDGVVSTDHLQEQLRCLYGLMRIEPNPETVQRFLDRTALLLGRLERRDPPPIVAAWIVRYRELATELTEPRPDVAATIAAVLTALCSAERASRLIDLAQSGDEGRAGAGAMIAALGPDVAVPLLEAGRARSADVKDGRMRVAGQLLADRARLTAPPLAAHLAAAMPDQTRVIVRVLGLAGAGYEPAVATQLQSADAETVREALRALAHIGTAEAVGHVIAEIEKNRGWIGGAAEETLWRFAAPVAHQAVRELLARREFVQRHPDAAARLVDRAAHAGATGLDPILETFVGFRYRFWNPPLRRLAIKAKGLLHR